MRAVHLELVPDLTARAFICCLKRFTARRGIPQRIVSDNSKTFKSANKVLRSLLNTPEVQQHFRDPHIEWLFILEKAPWWGGFFERMIQSVKRCLRKVIGKAILTYDELGTVLAEMEATLNSCPISYLSSEDIEEPLTPSHLMPGRRLLTLPDFMGHEDHPTFGDADPKEDLTRRMRHLSQILEHFWKRWRNEYLSGLRESHCYGRKSKPAGTSIAIGDIVLIYDPSQPRTLWRIGRVVKLLPGLDGAVRGASLQVRSSTRSTLIQRPIQKLYLLESSMSFDPNSVTDSEFQPTVRLTHSDDETQSSETESRPRRVAAQVARYRLKELIN